MRQLASRKRLVILAALVVVVSVAVLAAPSGMAPSGNAAPSRLPTFSSCKQLLEFAQAGRSGPGVIMRAAPLIRTPELQLARQPGLPETAAAPVVGDLSSPSPTPGAREQAALAPGQDYSTTNIQEQGVDEPDLMKTDGRRLFVASENQLRSYDVTGDTPKLLGKIDLDIASAQLLLVGDRLLVLGIAPVATNGPGVMPMNPGDDIVGRASSSVIGPYSFNARLIEIHVADASAMTVARSMTVPGTYVSARLVGSTARVVISSAASEPVAQDSELTTRSVIPRTVLRSKISGRTFRRPLTACSQVRHPRRFAGNDLLTVLTVDLSQGLFNVDRDSVLAAAQTVYASPTALYIASQRAVTLADDRIPEGMRTEIHRFDTSKAKETTYSGSGSVAGFVLNQYALSEHNGALRVASTEEPIWLANGPAEQEDSESAITVLRPAGDKLAEIGRLGGLGKRERIYAVRFLGERGYLVTFRQIDPLYTLDLADPTTPKVLGELKITGYSAYLHPLGDGLLLGVGQEASTQGQRLGAQVSVFDVKDPARPKRVAQRILGSGTSATEFDARAFLWWEPTRLALLPYTEWSPTTGKANHAMVGLRAANAGTLTEVGRITHGPESDRAEVVRSVIVGTKVISISAQGLVVSRLATLAPVGVLRFTE